MIFLTSLKYWIFIYLLMIPTYYESESLDKLEKKVNKELRKPQMWLNVS